MKNGILFDKGKAQGGEMTFTVKYGEFNTWPSDFNPMSIETEYSLAFDEYIKAKNDLLLLIQNVMTNRSIS